MWNKNTKTLLLSGITLLPDERRDLSTGVCGPRYCPPFADALSPPTGGANLGHLPVSLPSVPGMNRYFQPFYQPNECGKALCVRPDVMELDELYEFPEYSRDPTMYLALRNLILALWYTNCKVSARLRWWQRDTSLGVGPGLCSPGTCRGEWHVLCLSALIFFPNTGSAHPSEVHPPYHCPRPGAHSLRAGSEADSLFYDQEGPHQHGSAQRQL